MEELESEVQEDWEKVVQPHMDAGDCLYICEGRMERMIEAHQTLCSEYWNRVYQMMRHPQAMGKADGMVAGLLQAGAEEGELENKLLRSWEGPQGNALACWCEERMQELASAYERDVLKVRRCIHSSNGRGIVRASDEDMASWQSSLHSSSGRSRSSWESKLQLDGQQEYTGE